MKRTEAIQSVARTLARELPHATFASADADEIRAQCEAYATIVVDRLLEPFYGDGVCINEDEEALEFYVSAGHAEYLPPVTPGLSVTDVWPLSDREDLSEWELEDFTRLTGISYEKIPDVDLNWETIQRWKGTPSVIAEALTILLGDLAEIPGGDDDTYDYWPSGVRLAAAVADELGGEWPRNVEAVARRVMKVKNLTINDINVPYGED